MNDTNPKFSSTDAILLSSIAYRQRHNEVTTLGGILLGTEAINREYPMARELEDGFSRLIVGGFVEFQEAKFATTESGINESFLKITLEEE